MPKVDLTYEEIKALLKVLDDQHVKDTYTDAGIARFVLEQALRGGDDD